MMDQSSTRRHLENPFRIGGVVSAPYFTDREAEVARIRRSLAAPQDHLLVYGPRRMGKTSILRVVQEELREEGQSVIMADLSSSRYFECSQCERRGSRPQPYAATLALPLHRAVSSRRHKPS